MTLPATITNLVATLEGAQASTPQVSSGDFLFLKMSKAGEWIYGADETEVAPGSAFAIDPSSYAQGYIAWADGQLIDEKMALAGQVPVTLADLPELPAGVRWDSQVAFAMKGLEGAEEGLQMLYKVSSRGGKEVIATLLGEIIAQGKAGKPVCPIVTLSTSSYKHKKYGKIYTPVLTVADWIDLPEPGAAPEPKAVAEPEPAPEPDKPKRARRSRRAA